MAADLVDARLRPASPRLDCDLSLSQRYIWTMQGEQGCRKQWHVRSLIDGLHVAPTLDRTRALTWTLIPVSGRLGLLCITCALPLGIVKSCVVGSSSIAVTEWIYLPAETGHADGLLFVICDQELDVSQDREQLVLESSLLVQRAEARSGSMQMRDFPRHARCAILSLVANRALMPQSGSLWSDLLHLSGVAAGPDVPIVDVVLSSIDDEAEVRGILSVASWPSRSSPARPPPAS